MHAIPQTRAGLILAALVALLLPAAAPAWADDVTALPGLVRDTATLAITEPDGSSATLEALVIRPEGSGPFPLALITHGMPRDKAMIPANRPELYSNPAIAFAQHGYAAVVVMRRGYGRSSGPFAETLGPCDNRDYAKAGEAAADDVLGALAVLRTERWIDPARIVLVGHSMGGFAVLAAASHAPSGVLGTISFAGGVGSPWAGYVCQPDRLLAADHAFGQASHVPTLWLFAQNDSFFGPDIARRMFDAYTSGGAPAKLIMAPPIGHDGHALIFAPPELTWWHDVAGFLASVRLPTELAVRLLPPAALSPPDVIDTPGREAFAHYVVSRTYEKAFAVDPAGHYGVAYGKATISDAARAALIDCQRFDRVCRLYAVGNAPYPPP